MSRNGISGEPDRDVWRPSKTEQKRNAAMYLAQLGGGEFRDYLEEVELTWPRDPVPYRDDDLTNAGFALKTAYQYGDKSGKLLYEVLRYEHGTVEGEKTFRQRRRDPTNTVSWVADAGLVKVPYNWPQLEDRKDEPVFFVEGEKDADRLMAEGLLATTLASQKWSGVAAKALAGRDVVIIPDNDSKGRENAEKAEANLQGFAASIRIVMLPGLRPSGDVSDWLDAGHSREELLGCVASVRPTGASAGPYEFPSEEDIPQWEWLYGKHLLRRTVSGTAAAGGTGKSTLAITEALSMAGGKQLLGEMVPFPMRVLLINLEDDRNTMDKRIAAAMRHHGLTKEDVADRLFVIAKGERKLKLAHRSHTGGFERDDRTIAWLTNFIIDRKIHVASIDPLIKTHEISESVNEQMASLVEILEEVAERANCAIHLWHHTRKGNGSEVNVDSVRGASAFVDACRVVRILETMSKTEAAELGINNAEKRFYIKMYNGKLNFSPPIDKVKWCRLNNIEIKNGRHLFGDEVGVISSWSPDVRQGTSISDAQIAELKRAVAEHNYREDIRANMWAGKLVGQVLGIADRDGQKRMLKQLLDLGVLKLVAGRNAKRESCMFVEAGDGPVSFAPTAPGYGNELGAD